MNNKARVSMYLTITKKYFVHTIVDRDDYCIHIKQCRKEGTFTFKTSTNQVRFVALHAFCDLCNYTSVFDCVDALTRDPSLSYDDECNFMIKKHTWGNA